MPGVGESRRLRAGLTGEIAQPEHPLAGGVAHGGPERPSLGRRAERQLLIGHRRDDVAEASVVLGPHAVGRSYRRVAHAAHRTPRFQPDGVSNVRAAPGAAAEAPATPRTTTMPA